MNKRLWAKTVVIALLSLSVSYVNAAGWDQQGVQKTEKSGLTNPDNKLMASDFCNSYNVSGAVSGPGSTNGNFGDVLAGDTFTFTATGNGTGTWRIVGDPEGTITYASGGVFPRTLTYTFPADETGVGIGFYVDTYTGDGDTISGVCGDGEATGVPTMTSWSQILMIALLGLFGLAAFRYARLQ